MRPVITLILLFMVAVGFWLGDQYATGTATPATATTTTTTNPIIRTLVRVNDHCETRHKHGVVTLTGYPNGDYTLNAECQP